QRTGSGADPPSPPPVGRVASESRVPRQHMAVSRDGTPNPELGPLARGLVLGGPRGGLLRACRRGGMTLAGRRLMGGLPRGGAGLLSWSQIGFVRDRRHVAALQVLHHDGTVRMLAL